MDERKRKRLERRWQRLIKDLRAFAEESGIPEPMLVMGWESGIYAYPNRVMLPGDGVCLERLGSYSLEDSGHVLLVRPGIDVSSG